MDNERGIGGIRGRDALGRVEDRRYQPEGPQAVVVEGIDANPVMPQVGTCGWLSGIRVNWPGDGCNVGATAPACGVAHVVPVPALH
jgi:hypothetical protein